MWKYNMESFFNMDLSTAEWEPVSVAVWQQVMSSGPWCRIPLEHRTASDCLL
jgi:hypothetical protein